MTDNEERDIGFQELQAKPTGSRAEYQYLSEAPSGRWRDGSYGNSPLMGSVRDGARIMGCSRDWQVRDSFFPQRLVGESHHGNHRGIKRPAPADLGSDFTDPARVTWRGFPGEGLFACHGTAYASCRPVGLVTAFFYCVFEAQ